VSAAHEAAVFRREKKRMTNHGLLQGKRQTPQLESFGVSVDTDASFARWPGRRARLLPSRNGYYSSRMPGSEFGGCFPRAIKPNHRDL
jgi:hypothetical protein